MELELWWKIINEMDPGSLFSMSEAHDYGISNKTDVGTPNNPRPL